MARSSREPNGISALSSRLESAVHTLRTLDDRRWAMGDPAFGSNIERLVISRELDDLAAEIASDPGPLAPYLTPPWRGRRNR